MHVACKFPNGKIVYATLSGGILTGLQDASAESTKTAEKNGRLFVQWLTVDDWNEHVRHSNLLLGETPLKPAPAA